MLIMTQGFVRQPACGRSLAGDAGRQAVAAMEFGLLAPVMAIMLIAVFNIAKVLILWEQCWSAAQSIAESATTLAVQTDDTNKLTYQQANTAMSAVFAEIPWVTAGIATGNYTGPGQLPANTMTVVLTSVDYAPRTSSGCTSNCPYAATVKWSKAYTDSAAGFNSNAYRPCGGALAGPSLIPTSLGNNVAVSDPFVIADVRLTYMPWLFSAFLPQLTLSATAYVPVRTSPPNPATGDGWVQLDEAGDPDGASVCPNAVVTG